MKKHISIFIITAFYCSTMLAQDAPMSLFTSSPLYHNPANIGVYKDAKTKMRAQLNHRSQWGGILSTAMTINCFSFDMPIPDKKFSVGALLMNNAATEGAIKDFSFLLGGAYNTILSENRKKSLSLGIQFGFRQKSFVPEDLDFGDELVAGEGFNDPTSEKFTETSLGYFDFNFGALWYVADKWSKFRPWVGISATHLTEPEEYFADIKDISTKNFRKYVGNIGAYIDVTSAISVVPKVNFRNQNNISQFDMGVMGYMSNQKKQATIIGFGGYLRAPSESFIPMVSFEWDNYIIMLDYEINISSLNKVSGGGVGSFEIGIRYNMKSSKQHNVKLM